MQCHVFRLHLIDDGYKRLISPSVQILISKPVTVVVKTVLSGSQPRYNPHGRYTLKSK